MIGVLFDIDGTLLSMQGQGAGAFVRGVQETWQLDDDLSWIQFAGATDLDLLKQIAQRCKIDLPPDRVAEFFTTYTELLRSSVDPSRVEIKPMASELVRACHDHPEIQLGLVIGNARDAAFIKVGAAGLDAFFSDGGFGDEHPVRSNLVALAMDRIPADRYWLIGDTPNDITAGIDNKIGTIGVATGSYSEEKLKSVHVNAQVISDLSCVFNIIDYLSR